MSSTAVVSNLLQIDRTIPFSPVVFIDTGWSIAEQDNRSLAFNQVDLNKVTFETMLRSHQVWIRGEEKLRRLKEAGHIRLDARVFQVLWENQGLIPEDWKTKGAIFFDGTVLRDSCGNRYVLVLIWRDDSWRWFCNCLYDGGWFARYPSACLAT